MSFPDFGWHFFALFLIWLSVAILDMLTYSWYVWQCSWKSWQPLFSIANTLLEIPLTFVCGISFSQEHAAPKNRKSFAVYRWLVDQSVVKNEPSTDGGRFVLRFNVLATSLAAKKGIAKRDTLFAKWHSRICACKRNLQFTIDRRFAMGRWPYETYGHPPQRASISRVSFFGILKPLTWFRGLV